MLLRGVYELADKTVITLMREALKNAETGSAFITRSPTMGASLETILFSTTRGSKILCGIGIETMLDSSAWTTTGETIQGAMVKRLMVKIDNQLRIKSSNAHAMIEFCNLVADRDGYDDPSVGTGSGDDGGHSFHIYPVSGVGGRQCQVDIDVETYVNMITTGTFNAARLIITPYYSDNPMPIFSAITGGTPATGTGGYKLQVSGDFVGNGFLEMGVLIGDGTIVADSVKIVQEDGKLLLDQKENLRAATAAASALRCYWQNLFIKTVKTNSCGFFVNATIPWSINSTIEVEVSTTGAFTYALIFKNSPTETSDTVRGEPSTPTPEPKAQPRTESPSGPNTRLVGGTGPIERIKGIFS